MNLTTCVCLPQCHTYVECALRQEVQCSCRCIIIVLDDYVQLLPAFREEFIREERGPFQALLLQDFWSGGTTIDIVLVDIVSRVGAEAGRWLKRRGAWFRRAR
jgi:hypothetical protein